MIGPADNEIGQRHDHRASQTKMVEGASPLPQKPGRKAPNGTDPRLDEDQNALPSRDVVVTWPRDGIAAELRDDYGRQDRANADSDRQPDSSCERNVAEYSKHGGGESQQCERPQHRAD